MANLLRLWQVKSKEGPTWRDTLQSPHKGECTGFASFEESFDFLREQTAEPSNHQDRFLPGTDVLEKRTEGRFP